MGWSVRHLLHNAAWIVMPEAETTRANQLRLPSLAKRLMQTPCRRLKGAKYQCRKRDGEAKARERSRTCSTVEKIWRFRRRNPASFGWFVDVKAR